MKWREDVSNEKLDYSRNKLRNVFIPEMEISHPKLKSDVLYLIEKFQDKGLLGDTARKQNATWFPRLGVQDGLQMHESDRGIEHFDASPW